MRTWLTRFSTYLADHNRRLDRRVESVTSFVNDLSALPMSGSCSRSTSARRGRSNTTAGGNDVHLEVPGRRARTPCAESIAGDEQADREVHGGPDKAVYAYAREDIGLVGQELGRELDTGTSART